MKRLSKLFLILAIGTSISAAWAQQTAAPASGTAPATPAQQPAGNVSPADTTLRPVPVPIILTPVTKTAILPGGNINPANVTITAPLTMDQAIELAFQYNPSIRIALDQAQRAIAVIAENRAAFNPHINGQISEVWQPQSTVSIPGGPGSVVIQPGQNTILSANFLLPLDTNKRLSFATQIAEYQFQIQYLNVVGSSERLIFTVKSAYYTLLRACGQEQVAAAAVADAEVQLKDARAKFTAGTAARYDVTRAEVQVANNNQTLIQARRAVSTAQSGLNQVLGINVTTPINLAGPPAIPTVANVDVTKGIDAAYTYRPEVITAQTSIVLNQTNVRLQRSAYYPALSANGTTSYSTTSSGFSSSSTNWQASLNLTFPIWDGGVIRARIQEARADVLNSQNTLDQTKLNVSNEVRTSALNLAEAAERIKTTAANVALAEETLRLANVRYTAGISPIVEVTDAQSALTQARFNYVNAQFDYATALADYERATATQPELQKLQILDSNSVCFG